MSSLTFTTDITVYRYTKFLPNEKKTQEWFLPWNRKIRQKHFWKERWFEQKVYPEPLMFLVSILKRELTVDARKGLFLLRRDTVYQLKRSYFWDFPYVFQETNYITVRVLGDCEAVGRSEVNCSCVLQTELGVLVCPHPRPTGVGNN